MIRTIHIGIGGWSYEPWRSSFYPAGLPHSHELHHASRQLTAIEINSTFYGTQTRATFAKWRDETPEGFVFPLKASRFATHRKRLADAGEAIARFVGSGISELGPKLGPIVWQFMPTQAFEPEDFEAFLRLLPRDADGLALRHVLDVRHASFMTSDYLRLARRYQCASVFTDADDHPSFADITGDFVYARLMRCDAKLKYGYAPRALDRWAEAARTWAAGGEPEGLPRMEDKDGAAKPREVFMFFINGAKEKAPAAAQALLQRLGPG